MMEQIVERYTFLEENPRLLKGRLLSEQDMSTKFILPMLEALNWDPLKITIDGPEVHEKGFRARDIKGDVWEKARHGLPDFCLRGTYSKVPFFVEVKHPVTGALNLRDLPTYEEAHLIFLTSFKESCLVVVGSRNKRYKYEKFTAISPKLYISEFANLWKHISNTKEADGTRRAIKAVRH
jgi:hypothetical protein